MNIIERSTWIVAPFFITLLGAVFAIGNGFILARGIVPSLRQYEWQHLNYSETLLVILMLFASIYIFFRGIQYGYKRRCKMLKHNRCRKSKK
jgi:hypothetical protein